MDLAILIFHKKSRLIKLFKFIFLIPASGFMASSLRLGRQAGRNPFIGRAAIERQFANLSSQK